MITQEQLMRYLISQESIKIMVRGTLDCIRDIYEQLFYNGKMIRFKKLIEITNFNIDIENDCECYIVETSVGRDYLNIEFTIVNIYKSKKKELEIE